MMEGAARHLVNSPAHRSLVAGSHIQLNTNQPRIVSLNHCQRQCSWYFIITMQVAAPRRVTRRPGSHARIIQFLGNELRTASRNISISINNNSDGTYCFVSTVICRYTYVGTNHRYQKHEILCLEYSVASRSLFTLAPAPNIASWTRHGISYLLISIAVIIWRVLHSLTSLMRVTYLVALTNWDLCVLLSYLHLHIPTRVAKFCTRNRYISI